VAEGPRAACQALVAALGTGSAPGRADVVTQRWSAARGVEGFRER